MVVVTRWRSALSLVPSLSRPQRVSSAWAPHSSAQTLHVLCPQGGERAIGTIASMVPSAAARSHVIMVGDIHGCLDKLTALWERLETHLGHQGFPSAEVIFLGDYVDRGPNSSGVLDWLCSLPRNYPQQRHIFLAGNHDFSMAAFLGLANSGVVNSEGWTPWRIEPDLWRDPWDPELSRRMHLQGRRWGAPGTPGCPNSFHSGQTFSSYGVHPGDRAALLAAVPEAHQLFLKNLQWVHEGQLPEDAALPGVTRVVAVHAGLECTLPVAEQMAMLRAKRTDSAWIEPLQGRRNVLAIPSDLGEDALLVSGHHTKLDINGRRIVLDSCGGHKERPLSAVVWPGRHVVQSEVVFQG